MWRCRHFVPYRIRLLEATEVNRVLPACVCTSCKSDPGMKGERSFARTARLNEALRGPLIEKQQNKNPIWNSFGPKFSRFPELPEWNLLGTFLPPPLLHIYGLIPKKRRRGPPSSNLAVHREQRSQRWGGGLLVVDRTVLESFVEKWKWKKDRKRVRKVGDP